MSVHHNGNDVDVKLNSGIMSLTLCRTDKKNALTLEMYSAMKAAFEDAAHNSEIRVVIITGAGNDFCAGNDIQGFLSGISEKMTMDHPTPAFIETLIQFDKPVIAAVRGHAVGIGTTMLLHCDFVYADNSARFQLPFVQLGVCPEAASSYLLPRLMGHPRAMEWLLLGKRFNAVDALADRMINEIVDNPLEQARETARAICKSPPASVRVTKRLMRETSPYIKSVFHQEFPVFAECLHSDEAKEAFNAFMEKREPNFSQFN